MKGIVLAILLMQLALVETAAQSVQVEEVLRVLGQGAGRGAEAAPITIIEFSDFQCAYCRKFWQETLPRLEAEYVKPGKVRFVYRRLAILGEQSVSASQAAECAREQGKFWEYHDRLFASQGPFAFATGNLKRYAKDLGLDPIAFNQCFDTPRRSTRKQELEKCLACVGPPPSSSTGGR